MAKRLSSIFSLSRDDKRDSRDSDVTTESSAGAPPVQYLGSPPTYGSHAGDGGRRLHKHHTSSLSTDLDLNAGYPSLAPPPLLHESGPRRPPSSQRSTSDSRGSSPFGRVHSREDSRSRPQTPSLGIPSDSTASPGRPTTPTSAKIVKRKTWVPGTHPQDESRGAHKTWIAGLKEYVPYDVTPIVRGDALPDLWNARGDTFVYLYPPSARKGPSLKIDSGVLASSKSLMQIRLASPTSPVASNDALQHIQSAFSDMSLDPFHQHQPQAVRQSMNFSVPTINTSFGEEKHLYLPLPFKNDLSVPGSEAQGDDFELLVLYRNFFAFLLGGALVSTARQVTLFSIFMGITTILKRFGFSNADGSTYGDVPHSSFAKYCDELRLADVRSSREKTIEAIVLAENLRDWALYSEAFAHAVGRLTDIKSIKSPKYETMSPVTMNRLERAHLDLEQRLLAVRIKLEDFDFPSMFAGIANSQTSTEAKLVRFKSWKASFLDFRKFTLAFYKRKYGSWPPKASSGKNRFEENGLNRLLLKEVYNDFTGLYDVLVDRTSITTRSTELQPMAEDAETHDLSETIQHALRRVESEYDRATPPVLPPIPFDTPLIPQFSHSFNRNHVVISDKHAMQAKKLREAEVNEVLLGSYNRESIPASSWIQDFFNYERMFGRGKTLDEVVDARCGQWLFTYAVLQSLPMTVVDARDVRFSEGVEYFLCVPPRGGRPWMKEDTSTSRTWFNVANGSSLVNLPADVVDHSVEGIYRRSHCWTEATKWAQNLPVGESDPVGLQLPSPKGFNSPHLSPAHSPYLSPQLSPMLRPVSPSVSDGRSQSRDRSPASLGLRQMETPPERVASRPASSFNPNITFDAILGAQDDCQGKKKGKK